MFGPIKRYQVLLILFFVSILYYSLLRGQYLVWNHANFSNLPAKDILMAFLLGIRFDFAAQAMLMAPLVLLTLIPWPRKFNRLWMNVIVVLFVVLQIPFAILNQGDTEFINFVGRRFTYDTLFLMSEMQGKVGGFVTTYGLLMIFNFCSLLAFVLGSLWAVRMSWKKADWQWSSKQAFKWAGSTLLALIIIIVSIRGGVQNKPINIVEANRLAHTQLSNMALNSTFTFIKSYSKPSLEKRIYFSAEELKSYLPDYKTVDNRVLPQKGGKIVLIVLESFGKEYVGPRYTPFLDSLCKKSFCPESSYANGRRSVEGIAAALAGVPALMNEPFISSAFSANEILPLGKILEEEGYQTSFFHGGRNGTMHFDAFTQGIGISSYFGANEYPNSADDDGIWGIWDEPFLQWMLDHLKKQERPFFSAVFTLSSHHPFKLPEKYKDRFEEGPNPLTKMLQYTDMSLEKFFASAAKEPWFEDTVFIITADHTALHLGPETSNDIGDYKIPIMVYSPKTDLSKVKGSSVAQQMDIPFTIMELAGVEEDILPHPLASSLFAEGDKTVVNFIDGKFILFASDYQVIWKGDDLWNYFKIEDLKQENAIAFEIADPAVQKRLEYLKNRMKAEIQYFTEGMLENKLYKAAN